MGILYVIEQGATIRKEGHRLIVVKDDAELAELRCVSLDSVHLFGNVQVTTQALAELLGQGIDLSLYTLDGRLKGRLVGPLSKNIPLRHAQFHLSTDRTWCLARARELVDGKIRAALTFLRNWEKNHGPVEGGRPRRDLLTIQLQAREAADMDILRGYEGRAARIHFGCFRHYILVDFPWSGRNRRPPRDPVNALLSFSYMLLMARIQAQLEGAGLDPYLGTLHGLRHGRPALALDLLEPFRIPVADRFVLRSVNRREVRPDDFSTDEQGGVRMRSRSLREYLRRWNDYLQQEDWLSRLVQTVTWYKRKVATATGLEREVN